MKQAFLSAIFMTIVFVSSFGQQAAVRQRNFNLAKGVALEGYDPVSYFNGRPEKGSAGYTLTQDGVTYHFANTANMSKFKQSPAAYEPQYGGWCAYAMGSSGEKVEVDPETYKIIGGHLYLFYNKYFNNTLKTWNKNEAVLKPKADANWQKMGSK